MAIKYGFAGVNAGLNTSTKNPSSQKQLDVLASNMISARVTDIILDDQHPNFNSFGSWSSVGTIFFERVEGTSDITSQDNTTARPLIPYQKNYPLVNELVLLFLIPNRNIDLNSNLKTYYYLNPISIWNNNHINAFPNLQASTTTQPSQQKSYQAIEQGQTRKSSNEEVEYNYNSPLVGGTFKERSNIHPLLAFAGDVITEGRWGNSVRFGSTAQIQNGTYVNNWSDIGENGNPITIIRNGQPTDANPKGYLPIVENINEDLSSIYLTSNQTIPLKVPIPSNPTVQSNAPETIGSYEGSQIMVNSDRLVFSTKEDSILLNSSKTISLAAIGPVGLYSQEGDVVMQSGKNKVRLGDPNASQGVMLGDNFIRDFSTLLTNLQSLCQSLSVEPQLLLSTGPAASANTQVSTMLNNLETYTSKIVKTI